MGIVNVTPDSFSDGGRYRAPAAAVELARRHVAAGAACVDVGGESTRPGAGPIPVAEELDRVLPAVRAIRAELPDLPISVDTRKAAVAEAALAAGASMINDITAGRGDPDMLALVAAGACDVVLMHMRGEPDTMQDDPHYEDAVAEVYAFLSQRVAAVEAAGIAREHLVIDPGIGFGKRLEDNLVLLRAAGDLRRRFGLPLLIGLSRKSLLSDMLGRETAPDTRDCPSHVLHALLAGDCDLLRVHDVAGTVDALRLRAQLLEASA